MYKTPAQIRYKGGGIKCGQYLRAPSYIKPPEKKPVGDYEVRFDLKAPPPVIRIGRIEIRPAPRNDSYNEDNRNCVELLKSK